jgi:high affinity sulfate transporter 1
MSEVKAKEHADNTGRLARYLPIISWLPNYDRAWLKTDIIAGLSVWALMVPTSLGYATISGVPVQYGLYAAAVGLIAFALFTTSKQVTQGPSSSTAAVLGASVLSLTAAGSDDAVTVASAIVLVAGILFIIMYLLKMGWISEFLSASVLTGFTFGVAISIAAGELFKITGTESAGTNTWTKLWTWITSLPETSIPTLMVGIFALILIFGIKVFIPKVPGALVTVALGIGATMIFNLGDLGVELIGEVPRGLPSFTLPDLSLILDNLGLIVGSAMGLLLIGFSVTTAAVREYANKHKYRIDINQELLAQGMSNVSSGLFQGVFDNGSLSKSPVNDQAGAKSQISNLFQAVLILLTLMFLAPLFSNLPEAVLGAVIIEAVMMGMMDVPEMMRVYKVKRFEFWIAMAALLGVVTFGILQGVVIGVVLSIFWLVAVSALPNIPELGRKIGTLDFMGLEDHPDVQTFPGLSILRFDGGLFFVNAAALEDRLMELNTQAVQPLNGVIIDLEGVNFIDVEGADVIKKIAQTGAAHHVDLHLVNLKSAVTNILEKDGVIDLVGTDHIHDNIPIAVVRHLKKFPEDRVDFQDIVDLLEKSKSEGSVEND